MVIPRIIMRIRARLDMRCMTQHTLSEARDCSCRFEHGVSSSRKTTLLRADADSLLVAKKSRHAGLNGLDQEQAKPKPTNLVSSSVLTVK